MASELRHWGALVQFGAIAFPCLSRDISQAHAVTCGGDHCESKFGKLCTYVCVTLTCPRSVVYVSCRRNCVSRVRCVMGSRQHLLVSDFVCDCSYAIVCARVLMLHSGLYAGARLHVRRLLFNCSCMWSSFFGHLHVAPDCSSCQCNLT